MKKQLTLLLFCFLSFSVFSQTGTIKGVVTYYFNQNFGYKPDVGASIALLKQDKIEPFLQEINGCGYVTNKDKEEYDQAKAAWEELFREQMSLISPFKTKKSRALEAKTDSALKVYSQKQSKLMSFTLCKDKIFATYVSEISDYEKTIIDGSGNYSFKLDPGNYLVLIASKQNLGKVMKKVSILADKELNFSYQFDKVTEFTLIN